MSLFPAYQSSEPQENASKDEEWLRNETFKESKRRDRSRSRSRSPSKKRSKKKRSRSRSPRRKKKKRKSSKSPELNREELIAKHSAHKTFLEDVGISPEHAFRFDTAGDKSLSSASALPQRLTASYKRRWKYDEICKHRHAIERVRNKLKVNRYHAKDFQKVFNRPEQRQTLKDLSGNLKSEWNFQPRSVIRIVHEFVEEENEDDEDDKDFKHHSIQLKTKDFNEKLRKNPNDIDLWLDYIDFQDIAFEDSEFTLSQQQSENSEDSEKKSKKKSKQGSVLIRSKAIVEKKLSILKTALDHNPKSVILSVKRLNLSKELLDSSTLNRQWKELLFLFPTDVQAWDHYLAFLTSHFTTFTVSKITNAYKECFQRLQNMTSQAFRGDQNDLEHQMAFIIIKLWHLWSRAGFRERSVALFQALMELNLNAPSFPGYFSSQDKLATFEPFWESSVPRFGEENAPGWSKATNSKVIEGKQEVENEEDELIANFGGKVDDVQLWLKLELLRESNHVLPLRFIPDESNDDDDEIEDTDRVILFEQLDGFLYQFQDVKQVFRLFLAFLHFLGLDLFKDEDHLGLLGTQSFHDWLGINHPETIGLDDDDSSGVLLKVTGTSKKTAFFIKGLFSQATKAFPEPFRTQIMLLYLNYERQNLDSGIEDLSKAKKVKAKEIKATTMQFLQEDQNNIRVYISYALALNKLEGYKSAKKVFDLAFKALRSGGGGGGRKKDDEDLLLVHAARLELRQGHFDEAQWMLSLMAHQRTLEACNLNKLALLAFANDAREKATLELIRSQETERQDFRTAPILPKSRRLALTFGLLWLNHLLDNSLDRFEGLLQNSNDKSEWKDVYLEVSHGLKCDVIKSLESNPKVLKNGVQQWLQEFPRSSNALRCLASLNVQTAVSSAFWRSISASLTSKNASTTSNVAVSPIGHLAVIKVLINQFKLIDDQADYFGHLYKAWRLLNEFVKTEACRTCVQIWRLFMWTTKMLGSKNPFKYQTKTVFYRGLQDNPSAKVFGLDLIHYLDQGPSQKQTRESIQAEIQDIFTEKEVRLRMPLEELKVLLLDEEEEDK